MYKISERIVHVIMWEVGVSKDERYRKSGFGEKEIYGNL